MSVMSVNECFQPTRGCAGAGACMRDVPETLIQTHTLIANRTRRASLSLVQR